MERTAILVGSVGSLKAACITAGTFYAARDCGYRIVGMAGSSGGSIPLPILGAGVLMKDFVHRLSSVKAEKLVDTDILQQGIDWVRNKIGIPRKGDAPFTGLLRGNGLRSELARIYSLCGCSKFEQSKIPFLVSTSLVAPVRGASMDNPAVALLGAIATNREILFSSGDVVAPIRASTSIPLIFRPEFIPEIGVLVDGGVVDAIPAYPAIAKFGRHDVIIADATTDIFEETTYAHDINSIIDVAIATVHATVKDSTIVRLNQAQHIVEKTGKTMLRVAPTTIKIKMFEVEKVAEATNKAYQFAMETLSTK